jgi:hypothetical protein
MKRRALGAALLRWLRSPFGRQVIEHAAILVVLMGALALLGGGR